MDDLIFDDSEFDVVEYSPVCMRCVHWDETHWLETGKHRCAAFDAIPVTIWNGEHDHKTPYEGDGGVSFEPVTPEEL